MVASRYPLLAVAAAVVLSAGSTQAQRRPAELGHADNRVLDNELCFQCHADKALKPVTERGKTLDLYVTNREFAGSFHKNIACVDCHEGAQTFERAPHAGGEPLELVCESCHPSESRAYRESVHGRARARGDLEVPTCASCHGRHESYPVSDLRSSVNKFRLVETCGRCHRADGVAAKHNVDQLDPKSQYEDSIHGRVARGSGLVVAPTCNDCHGAHDIQPHEREDSHVSRANVPATCSQCHVLVEKVYAESVHGQLLAKGDPRAPICISCHSSHQISDAAHDLRGLGVDDKCGKCHEEKLGQYRETLHGKAIALGRENVASCDDCHGHHDMQPSKDPRSRIHDDNRLATCKKCHREATENFAGYLVHAHPTDKASAPELYDVYVVMNVAIIVVFGLYILYLVLWSVRSLGIYIRNRDELRRLRKLAREDKRALVRFSPVDRLLHALIIVGFVVLFVTGMPLKFYYSEWAQPLIRLMRGPDTASFLHRVGAVIVLACVAIHLLALLGRIWSGRARYRDPASGKLSLSAMARALFGPDTLWFRWQDVKDFFAQQAWLFGRGEKPQFDRFAYWEKLNYWAVVLSVVVIVASGLVMWFPEIATRFLPGRAINVALVLHSDITLLAAGFVLTFHFFSAHLRLEKFPFDRSIFTGRVSVTTLEQERQPLVARLAADGRLEKQLARNGEEWAHLRRLAVPVGVLIFLLGLALVGFVYFANIKQFLGAM